ncbi:MAG: FAD-binding oxidoreductase [Desulfohalobiaceae bacterium]
MVDKSDLRWNGWGLQSVQLPLNQDIKSILLKELGPGISRPSALLGQVLEKIPVSKAPEHPLLDSSPWSRLQHARGQSLPDWAQLRFGELDTFPDAVAYPGTDEQLQEVLSLARKQNIQVIPYGGGTSVLGHITPLQDTKPVITVSLAKMNQLLHLEPENRLAQFQPGIFGPDLEQILRAQGFTLGHFPQSFEFSSLGGWISTRSSGQQSLGYGRIEDIFQGGTLQAPAGELRIPNIPASAAGPDLRQLILGSEGRLGLLSKAWVRISPLPEQENFQGFILPDLQQGLQVAKELVQKKDALSLLRLSNARETKTNILLSGKSGVRSLLSGYLHLLGMQEQACMLLVGFSGTPNQVSQSRRRAGSILRRYGAKPLYGSGRAWAKHRFRAPYLRNSLWEEGYAVDTLETATTWQQVPGLMQDLEDSLCRALEQEREKAYVFSHLSHFYPTGCSIYCTYIFRVAATLQETMQRWEKLKRAASECILKHQATISHHHGVGRDHLPYIEQEKGSLGLELLRSICSQLDPQGVMNPGKLLEP